MGFFDLKATCMVCQKEIGLNRFKAKDGWVCPACFKKCGYNLATPIGLKTLADVQADMAKMTQDVQTEQQKSPLAGFAATKIIEDCIEFDETHRKWRIPEYALFSSKEKETPIYSNDDLLDYELWEDGIPVTRGTERILVRSANGRLISLDNNENSQYKTVINDLKIKVFVNDPENPEREIDILHNDETEMDSEEYVETYGKANLVMSMFDQMLNLRNNPEVAVTAQAPPAPPISAADEILKFKTLLDSGVITQEEFEAKKKQLLGL